MASGALPTHRYRKDSRAASALYRPRRHPGAANPIQRAWDRVRTLLRSGSGRGARLILLYLIIFLLVVCFLPLPGGLSSTTRDLLSSLLPPVFGGEGGGGDEGLTTWGDVLRYVDPLIGTAGGGHVFAGATVPYGMAKPVADSVDRRENAGGFITDLSHISGFSQLHDSGMLKRLSDPYICVLKILVLIGVTD